VQFTNRLRKKTGKTLPLAALLDTPTVASLARELDPQGSEQAQAADTAQTQPVAAGNRDIVTVRGGGTDTPLFLVHDGLGETLLYRGLALRLDTNRTVYGIEPLRNASGGFAHTRIDEMASNYVERMRAIQPHGPYLLAGLCAGGVIAFEMARQLQDSGEPVDFVGIIDAADVAAAKRPFYVTRARVDRIRTLLADESVITLVPALVRKAANAVRWEIASRMAVARDRRTVQQLRTANETTEKNAEVQAAEPSIPFLKLYEVAHTLHRPEGLFSGGKVALFKASSGNGEVEDMAYQDVYSDLALGWGKRVADEIALISVPGGHSSALQEPHVATLAPLFQQALDAATAPATREPLVREPIPHDQGMVAAE
jgi:thioesterase domain-containing protein